jgi:hypothetical protein
MEAELNIPHEMAVKAREIATEIRDLLMDKALTEGTGKLTRYALAIAVAEYCAGADYALYECAPIEYGAVVHAISLLHNHGISMLLAEDAELDVVPKDMMN